MKKILLAAACIASLTLTGCANVTSGQQFEGFTEVPTEICIVKNPRVKFTQALDSITMALAERRIKYHVAASEDECKDCQYILHYEARRSWDFATYLRSANLRLFKNGLLVAKADYKAGPATLTKFGNTTERIDGMVGELLGQ